MKSLRQALLVASVLPFAGCDLFRDLFAAPGDNVPCPDDTAIFASQVFTPVMSQTCVNCHVEDGVAGSTHMVLRKGDSPEVLAYNLAQTKKVASVLVDGESIFVRKPRGELNHGGGVVVAQGTEEEEKLAFWADWTNGRLDACEPLTPVFADGERCAEDPATPRLLRRLTHREFENTIGDLLKLDGSAAAGFPGDPIIKGFKNNASALVAGDLLVSMYAFQAEQLADQVVASKFEEVVGCGKTGNCGAQFVERFGQRAFRRPLTNDEKTRYTAALNAIASESDFAEGVKWTIAAILQSPHFLYKPELGTRTADGFRLTDWEIATELSYLFWESMPDDLLFEKAEAGLLRTPQQIQEQALRLSMNPRADSKLQAFVNEWLALDRFESTPKDAATFPEFTQEVRGDMRGEVTRLWRELLMSGGTLADAMRADHSFMTDRLAAFYGVQTSGDADTAGFKRASLQGTGYQGGVLRLGALIATQSSPNQSSPIHRGKLIRERLLCQDLPPPPPNVGSVPEVDASLSTRERFSEHSSNASCKGCHELMDPIGFGFESFDGVGRFRAQENNRAIDTSGEVLRAGDAGGTFDGIDGLANLLAGSRDLDVCYAKNWLTFGTGVAKGDGFACTVQNLSLDNPTDGASLTALQVALTRLNQFSRRTGEPGELDGLASEVSVPFSADDDLAPPVVVTPPNSPEPIPPPATSPGTTTPPPATQTPPATTANGLSLQLQEESRWETGYCVKGIVKNTTASDQEWRLSAPVQGRINNIWNAAYDQNGGTLTFRGIESWNKTVPAGGTLVAFGFCAGL